MSCSTPVLLRCTTGLPEAVSALPQGAILLRRNRLTVKSGNAFIDCIQSVLARGALFRVVRVFSRVY